MFANIENIIFGRHQTHGRLLWSTLPNYWRRKQTLEKLNNYKMCRLKTFLISSLTFGRNIFKMLKKCQRSFPLSDLG